MAPIALPNGYSHVNGSGKAQPSGTQNGVKERDAKDYTASTVAGIINKLALASNGGDEANNATSTAATSQSTAQTTVEITPTVLRSAFRGTANSVWIVTSAWDGQPVGFTAITVNSVSVDPPMISFNIGRSSSSLTTLSRSLKFAVHQLAEGEGATAQRFAGSADKRFSDPATWRWHQDGLPDLIPGALARLSGNIVSLASAGDNLIAIGALDNITHRPGNPLVYHQGIYRELLAPEGPRKRNGRIYLNAFDMCCVGHQNPGLWTHPNDTASTYKDLEYWTNLAQLLERGGFDSLFLADVLGIYDVYQNSRDPAIRSGAQVPVNDPTIPISAMAAVTKKLGFGITVSLTYELPYAFARRMSTLDHLTKGRVAWNVVTSYLKSAAENLGLDAQIPHDERYNIADEFIEVCYKLWEGSWEDDAVIRDRAKGIYTDPAKVHDIKHKGKYYNVPGPHLSEPSPQRTPFIFQAGASTKGQAFAGKHAEAVFISGPNAKALARTVEGVRRNTAQQGRDPASVKVFTLVTIVTGPTDAEAQAKLDEYREHASVEGALALYGGWAGVDLAQTGVDTPLEYVENDAIRSVNQMWSKQGGIGETWTPRKIGKHIGVGGLGPVMVGSGPTIADKLEAWIDETGVDGFNLAYAVTPGTFEDIIEYVVPELRKRGRLPPVEENAPRRTLREHMGGAGSTAHVGKDHPAYGFKVSK